MALLYRVLLFYPKRGDDLMDVYLTNEKENDTFHFPVNPFVLTINREKKYITADIIDIGEVDINDKGTKIGEISFETLLPDIYEPYCRYIDIPDVKSTIEKLEKWQDQVEPLRLIITDTGLNKLVNLNTMNEEIKPEGTNGKYFTFTFRTYRDLKITKTTSSLQLMRANSQTAATSASKYSHHAGEWIVVTSSALNVRNAPGTNSKIIGTVSNGQCYKIGSVQGNWAAIYWGDHGGWICTDYVK